MQQQSGCFLTSSLDFKKLVEAAPGCIAVVEGPQHVFRVANAAYRSLVGERDLIGLPAAVALPELEEQGFITLLDDVYRTGKRYTAEAVPVSLERGLGDKEIRFISFVYEPILDSQGEVTGIFAEGIDVTAAAEAVSSKEAVERRLDAVLDNASVAVFLMDEKQQCSYMNAAAERLTGYSFAETRGRPLHDVIHHTKPDGSPFPLHECPIDRAFPENNNMQGEEVFVHKDGHFYPVTFTASPIRNEGSKTVGTIIEARDISAERAVEEGRLASERQLRLALEAGRMAVWELDLQAGTVVTSQALNQLLGFPADARPTLEQIRERYYPGERERLHQLSTATIASGQRFVETEFRYVRAEDDIRWFLLRAEFSAGRTGLPERALGVVVDVTDRKVVQEALEEQSAILETLNRTGAALSAELELERVVQIVTDAGVELTGAQFGAFFYTTHAENGESMLLYTLSGADREAFDGFGHPRPTAVFKPTFDGEGVVRSDDITADPRYGKNEPHSGMPKGHLPLRSYLAVPVLSRSGDVMGGLFFGHPDRGVFSDRSERLMLGLAGQAAVAIDNARLFAAAQRSKLLLEQRVLERTRDLEIAHEALRQAQKMEAIGQLTGGIAHDFNNLLTVIRGSADLLRGRDLPEEKRKRYVDAISDTADRASRLTGQLLAFARRQALQPEVFDAAARIKEISEMLRTVLGPRVKLALEVECDDCFVNADPVQFETALVNLAVNARDAMEGEGAFNISLSSTDTGEMRYVAVAVQDTGHGISRDQIERIFEPFFTTKGVGKGTGLGLSQVYGFAKQSGGEISVESEPGTGARFTLCLPAANPSLAPPKLSTDTAAPHSGRGRVLVVEDNEDVGAFATQLLGDLGFEPTLASSAEEALEHLGDQHNYDVVFTDVVMPGMSGVELGRTLRKRWPSLPIVLTSGYSHVLVEEGRHGFPLLQKPYSVEALARALREAQSQGASRS